MGVPLLCHFCQKNKKNLLFASNLPPKSFGFHAQNGTTVIPTQYQRDTEPVFYRFLEPMSRAN
ncbi:MAG: hypothetical protein CMH07_00375 [Marinovum sp.]|nr:hypothetical protein [Marinovum sp.]